MPCSPPLVTQFYPNFILTISIDIAGVKSTIDASSTLLAANPAKLTERDFSEFIFCGLV